MPATRDACVEILRGLLMLLVLSPALLELPALQPALQAIAPGAPTGHPAAAEALRLARVLAEGCFVLGLAFVAGSVFGQTDRSQGLARCTGALWRRARTYYLACVGVALAVVLVRLLPGSETLPLTQAIDPASGRMGATFPGAGERVSYQLFELIFLRASPGQFALLALCTALLALAPVLAWALDRGHTRGALIASVGVAALATLHADGATAAGLSWGGLQFEQHHALVAWQMPFAFAFTLGWHRPRWAVASILHRAPLLAGALVALALATLAASVAARQGLLAGPLRPGVEAAFVLLIGAPLLVAGHALLGFGGAKLQRAIGPVLRPLGQQPLAVCVLHGAWLLLWLQVPPQTPPLAALALAVTWLATWALVRWPPALRRLPH